MSLLEIENLHVYYGHIHALKGISINVEQGEIVTLIGGNGAGKTTTLRAISGTLRAPAGSAMRLGGKDLRKLRAHHVVEEGVIHVPEGRRVFARMSVQENLDMGSFARKDKTGIPKDLDYVFNLFPRLKERRSQLAGTLSGGEQQMLAMGRGLMANPKILLMDEPSMGLAPVLVEAIFDTIVELNRDRGIAVLLVEQNALMALQVANRGYVLETGSIVLAGPAAELQANPQVKEAYLGA